MVSSDSPASASSVPTGTVGDAMSHVYPRLRRESSVVEAARLLWTKGWLPIPMVGDEEEVAGAVSAYDVVRAVAHGGDPETRTIVDIAGTEVPQLEREATLAEAIAAMQQTGEQLVFVVEDSRFAGVLSLGDIETHGIIQAELGPAATKVLREISPNDLMYAGSWGAYARAGVTALQCIREVLHKVGRNEPASILDLPCGHGRELRFLKIAYPDAAYGVCDIDEDGVAFCARVFGGEPIVSQVEPAEVSFDRQYELAWSGSLFTHLSADRWPGFLEMFARALEPEGLVLFTANGYLPASILRNFGMTIEQAEQLIAEFRSDHFGYLEMSDGSWGLSLARPLWVKEQIERSPLELVAYEKSAWKPPSPAQDVVVCRLPAS